ncbi:MAG: hypothetical protein IT222_06640 [Crocinitomix sp.]|nr:hypothetical protein [Crocinitomix sp.]
MKFFASLSILAVCTILLTACPIGSSFPLGKKGEVKLNPELIGVWTTDATDVEATAVEFTKGTEANTYNFEVLEKGSMFMADGPSFIAWLTELNAKTFLVLQQVVDGVPIETYYVYCIQLEKKKMTSFDISLKVNGVDAITSIQAYRDEVKASMEFDDFLGNQIDWVRK